MRLLFIRHGDPDYENDTLTAKGIREAECLAEYIKKIHIDEICQSPLGRAKKTLEIAVPKTDLTIKTFEWLKEFPAQFDPNLSSAVTLKALKDTRDELDMFYSSDN